MGKRILITNDDGIEADGLRRLALAAKVFGEVWIVAPDGQRSAASHSITLHQPMDVRPVSYPVEGVKAYKCSGTPADCVRVGVLSIMPTKPDVVLSGINKGYNTASDIQYSATAGAAFEAVFQGIHGMALSEGFGECIEVSEAFLGEILAELIEKRADEGCIWNVNFPDCTLSECKGILKDCRVSRGTFYRDSYDVIEELPQGGVRLMVHGRYNEDAEEGTDFAAVVNGYVSIGQVNNIGW
ncbi:MAG: 5'/3'-nucleotidase SurE [Lachnospiraceae bacterium]|nr:5'/3'-nucleotidase SurE [Lachnospiraceae bacterium]